MRPNAFPKPLLPLVATLLACALATACVDTSAGRSIDARQYCEERAQADCRKYWQCLTEMQRTIVAEELTPKGQNIGTNQGECTINLKAACVTTPFSCGPNMVFQEMTAGYCTDALNSLSCDQLRRPVALSAPQCDRVCTPSTLGGGS